MEDWKQILRRNGLKVTSQRLAILQMLDNAADMHLTAEEIYDSVRKEEPEIGLATVYRTIQTMAERNILEKLNLGDGCVRYELSHRREQRDDGKQQHRHHHLVCLGCKQISSFEDDLLEQLEAEIYEKNGFVVTDHDVKLFGYCRSCRESRRIGKEHFDQNADFTE